MSRGKHFGITFAGLQANISISKGFSEQLGFVMTWKDPNTGTIHRVNTLRVVPKETGVRPKEVDQIHRILEWLEPESSYEYTDENGHKHLLPVDKTVLAKLFPKSDKITVDAIIDRDQIGFSCMAGDHYFVTPRVDSKSKTSDVSDIQAYALLYALLTEQKKVLLVKFISGTREKVAIIYVDKQLAGREGVLMLSTIIHSTYQRLIPANVGLDQVKRVAIPEGMTDKLMQKFRSKNLEAKTLEDTKIEDIYETQLKDYIKQLTSTGGQKPIRIFPRQPVTQVNDFFSLLADS